MREEVGVNSYEGVLAWLYGLEAAKGMDFKLERVELALASLGNPQRAYPCIHVAGTNGKGSVAAMCEAVLRAAGYRTGLYVSPHLVRFTERIRVRDEEISPDEVVALVAEIRRAATSRGIDLTFFEFVTVMGFLHLARRTIDAAVIEVGLGGRLDATNVVESEVAVITTIGLDHQEYLGDTLEQIAAEKAGILKQGRPAVIGRLPASAERVVAARAIERGCALRRLGADFSLPQDGAANYRGSIWQLGDLEIALRGRHQRDNAAVAIAALEAAYPRLPVDEAALRRGLAKTVWPGRFEVFAGSPTVVLDGAHNLDGVKALVQEVAALAAGRRVRLLFAVMRDKDWEPMARSLAEIASDVTVTSVFPPRGEAPERVAAVFARSRPAAVAADPVEGFSRLTAEASADDLVLVAGSLFLIGAVYPAVERLRALSRGEARPDAS